MATTFTLLCVFVCFSVQDLEQVEISMAPPAYLSHLGSWWPALPAFSSSVNTAVILLGFFLLFLSSSPKSLLMPTLPQSNLMGTAYRYNEKCDDVKKQWNRGWNKQCSFWQHLFFFSFVHMHFFVSAISCLKGLDLVWDFFFVFIWKKTEALSLEACQQLYVCVCDMQKSSLNWNKGIEC